MQIKKLLGLRSDDFHHIGIDLRCRGNDFALGEVIALAGEIGHDGAGFMGPRDTYKRSTAAERTLFSAHMGYLFR